MMKPTRFKDWLCDIRQLCYPEPIRIPRSKICPVDPEPVAQLIESLTRMTLQDQSADRPSFQQREKEPQFLADLATRLWRLEAGLKPPGSKEPFKEVRRAFGKLERLFSFLEEHGVRIIDKTGDFYDPGMMMTVISSEPMPGITREIIKETIEPMVMMGDDVIRHAQVIIGIPADAGAGGQPDLNNNSQTEQQ